MEEDFLTPIERQRNATILRNRALLQALGIDDAIAKLSALAPAPKKKPAARQPKKHPAPAAAAAAGGPDDDDEQQQQHQEGPSRQSGRVRDREMIARGEVPPGIEPDSEVGRFIAEGECPRCGKVLRTGHAAHLDVCTGPPESPPEDDVAAQAEVYKGQAEDKLRELELGGLVDYRPAAAAGAPAGEDDDQAAADEAALLAEMEAQAKKKKGGKKGKGKGAAAATVFDPREGLGVFIVVGSLAGGHKHYAVRLSNTKRTCECPDHRIRKRDCKHIKLVLQQLGVANTPKGWEQALIDQLSESEMGAAEEDDVERVRQQEERAAERKRKAAEKAAAAK